MWLGYLATLLLAPQAIGTTMFLIIVAFQTFLATAYIGGQVFDTYVKSKWFNADLVGK